MRRQNNISFPRVNGRTVVYSGGINEGITNLELRPGDLFRGINYEEIDGAFHGYSSVEGIERFDGRTSPSDVSIELLPDLGNDKHAVVVFETDIEGTLEDKSSNGFFITESPSSVLDWSDSRYKFFDGSWRFNNGIISKLIVDQTSDPIDYAADDWTFEGWIQISDATLATQIIAEKTGSWKLSIVNGQLYFEWAVASGPYTQNLTITPVFTLNRWQQFSVSVSTDSGGGTTKVRLGINGGNVQTATAGVMWHNATGDLTIGDGLNSTGYLWLDSFRLSKIARWFGDSYSYGETYPYTDGRFYAFNADDEAREAQRALIGVVDSVNGVGPVRDVHILPDGTGVAVRDKTGGTTAGLWKETSGGWTELSQDTYYGLYNASDIADDTVTSTYFPSGATWVSTSGATGILEDIVLESGDPTTTTGVGRYCVTVLTGTLGSGETVTLNAGGQTGKLFVTNGAPTKKALGGGANVDFTNAAFAYFPPGDPNSEITYFICNTPGVFSTDGTTIKWMAGPALDIAVNATKIAFFQDRLWLAYPDGHVFWSAPGDPMNWSGDWGAGEFFTGQDITSMTVAPGGILTLVMRNSIKIIKPNDSNTGTADYPWIARDFTKKSGGFSRTAVTLMNDIYYCDDRGPMSLSATDKFGDLEMGNIRKKCAVTFQSNKDRIAGAYVQREKSQYRVFFNDTTEDTTDAIFITMGSEGVKGVTLATYPVSLEVFHEGEDADGNIKIMAGATNGKVYLMDKGTSFDGEVIDTYLQTAYYHYSTPRLWKRFYRAIFEISSPDKVQFFFQPDYNYSSPNYMRAVSEAVRTTGEGGTWGSSVWGSFVWGGGVVSNPMVYLMGYGFNMSMGIRTSSAHHRQHTIHNMIVDYANGNRFM